LGNVLMLPNQKNL